MTTAKQDEAELARVEQEGVDEFRKEITVHDLMKLPRQYVKHYY